MYYHLTPFGLNAVAEEPSRQAHLRRGLALVLARALEAIARTAERFAEWQARARSRRELMSLDDRTLQDIGISRGDAYMEYSKPFWRD